MKTSVKFLMLLVLAGAGAHAARADVVLASNTPYLAAPSGQQSDASTAPAYTQSFATPSNAVVDKIEWWGYHGADSGGASFDNFVVTLGGVVQTGQLTETTNASGITAYTLALAAESLLSADTLAIINNSQDVAWFWESSVAVGNPNAADGTAVAFSLLGRDGLPITVPEPASLLLLLLAFSAMVVARRRI